MDLVIMFFGGVAVVAVVLVLLARMHPGSGADLLDWDPSKRFEARYAAEFEDAEQMLEMHNQRRRRSGLPEQTEDEFREEVSRRGRPR